MFRDSRLNRMAAFLDSIGIPLRPGIVDFETAFTGIFIDRGAVIVDEDRATGPGDALHEAAHIALSPAGERDRSGFLTGPSGGVELATIAWAWAASVAAGLDPEWVFHPASFKGEAPVLIEQFRAGNWIGLPLLQLWRMSFDAASAERNGVPPFPHMMRWLR